MQPNSIQVNKVSNVFKYTRKLEYKNYLNIHFLGTILNVRGKRLVENYSIDQSLYVSILAMRMV